MSQFIWEREEGKLIERMAIKRLGGKEAYAKAKREMYMQRRLDQIVEYGYTDLPVIIQNAADLVAVRLYLEALHKRLK